jgi:hypothetical protein
VADRSCPSCGRAFGPALKRKTTFTGRVLCVDCADGLIAAAVGATVVTSEPVAGAIATEGWFGRLRRFRRRRS